MPREWDMATRTVHHADAIAWLRTQGRQPKTAVVTSLPDVSEVGLSLVAWRLWFIDAARLCLEAVDDDQPCVFFQTDIKKGGVWIDKSALVGRAIDDVGAALLFRKVVCRKPPGTLSFGRPAYTHLLAASRGLRPKEPIGIPDVIPDAGRMTWVRAMGLFACAQAVRFVQRHSDAHTILDPFCGHGTVLAVANALGLEAVGVENNKKRALQARALTVDAAELALR